MNYELAKQLKDAGFPQTGLKYTWYYEGNSLHNSGEKYLDVKNNPKRIISPSLSELIEACGDKFGGLEYWRTCIEPNERWECYSEQYTKMIEDIHYLEFCVYGSTPEEAVAKLWLELNKK